MVAAFQCSQCSAPVQDDRWSTCPYCGTVLDKPTIDPLRALVAPERFAAAERAPAHAELMLRAPTHAPSGAGQTIGFGCQSVFLSCRMLGTVVIIVLCIPFGAFALLPAALGVLGMVLLWRIASRAVRFAQAPLERRLAVWRDERIEVSGSGTDSSATTRHFVLLEGRDGQRVELACDGPIAGKHAPGDIGVAYLRSGVLLDFQQLEV